MTSKKLTSCAGEQVSGAQENSSFSCALEMERTKEDHIEERGKTAGIGLQDSKQNEVLSGG